MTLAAPAARARCAASEPPATLRAIIVSLKTHSAPARRVCVGRMIPPELARPVALGASCVQEAFAEASAFRCGYCAPGFIMMLTKSLDGHSDPDDETIKQHLQQAVQPAH
jgi:[2Fe-2S] binding domain